VICSIYRTGVDDVWCGDVILYARRERVLARDRAYNCGYTSVDCDDEHKENESEKEPEEAKTVSLQEVYAESEARCEEKTNGGK
jgi:hypothetical protein